MVSKFYSNALTIDFFQISVGEYHIRPVFQSFSDILVLLIASLKGLFFEPH